MGDLYVKKKPQENVRVRLCVFFHLLSLISYVGEIFVLIEGFDGLVRIFRLCV